MCTEKSLGKIYVKLKTRERSKTLWKNLKRHGVKRTMKTLSFVLAVK